MPGMSLTTIGMALGMFGGAGAGEFSPDSLALAWGKSDAGLLQSSGGSAATSDGDPVGEWQDQTGNGFHIAQSATDNKPTLQSAPGDLINGYPVVRFDGTTDFLFSAALGAEFSGDDVPMSFWAVVKKASNNADHTLAALGNSGTDMPTMFFQTRADSSLRVFRRNGTGVSLQSSGSAIDTNPRIVGMVFTGTAVSVYVDGITVIGDGAMDLGSISIDRFALGALLRTTATQFAPFDTPEWFVQAGATSAGQRASIQQYFSDKYNIALA